MRAALVTLVTLVALATTLGAVACEESAGVGRGRDRNVSAAIRRAVVSDPSLSFNAKNVTITTVDGKVTLRGAVKSDAERLVIASKAKAEPGVSHVDNRLEVTK